MCLFVLHADIYATKLSASSTVSKMPSAESLAEDAEERRIQEDYKIWKKNAPLLYDFVFTQALDWPSLTVQWLPGRVVSGDKQVATHKVILGTHTSDDEPNYLMIANVRLPTEDAEIDARQYSEETGELGGYSGSPARFDIQVRITHEGEVNRARYCPGHENLIATKTAGNDVLVFDWHKMPSKPADDFVKPLLRLKGHTREGYGLAWSPHEHNKILSASDDKTLCMWDIASALSASAGKGSAYSEKSVDAVWSSKSVAGTAGHTDIVEDVQWHQSNPHIFGSVGDDRQLLLWDSRDLTVPKTRIQAHAGDAMSLSFNPFNEFLLVTGGTDKVIKLWDTRSTKTAMHTFVGHTEDVLSVSWSPFAEPVLCSSSADRRVMVWDCGLIGKEQDEEDAADGPPELLVRTTPVSLPIPACTRSNLTSLPSPSLRSSYTVATQRACPTCPGARATSGSWLAPLRTTSCRCGCQLQISYTGRMKRGKGKVVSARAGRARSLIMTWSRTLHVSSCRWTYLRRFQCHFPC